MTLSQNATWFNGMIQAGSTSAVTHNPLPLISHISAAVPTVLSQLHYNSTSSTSTPRPYSSSNLPDYLLKHKGCFRCRDIYVNHHVTECDMARNIHSSNWERTLSEAELESRRRSWENCRKVVSAPVGCVTASIEDLDAQFEAAQNSDFLDGSSDLTINATFPLVSGYSMGSTSGASTSYHVDPTTFQADNMFAGAVMYDDNNLPIDDVLDDDEMYVLPSTSSPPHDHLLWTCYVDSPHGPSAHVQALIDHGCPTVLISNNLADGLDLCRLTLGKPLSLGGVGEGTFSCTHFVKLHVSSVDDTWKAQTVCALVVPQLHFDLILGLEWLRANKIIVDMAENSVVAKDSGYILLDASLPCLNKIQNLWSRHWT
ncbi:hypothetical protein AGABI2DRAFT_119174 [Agaricus bisporus var. bisporus H97]|uniref:hypothetical protein n=1 Tax=Agaricus bisporus var. bisporus (strain H97 / ATCC MYA-4626 / FGSC 10389) TaxID=936046 RepID=UPI00029F6468|nr:hypothetical protein AGABI2DRAFT_119174 [Agaricus bisporus var. bisporus H97]EKV45499.1 hypothetical protein AGABI2DRAFT_119174 [Agaricus bisporus var. bisporus H97]